jgi:divalent metal cation (Fe/Co/Zn/Cd) transporter
VTDNTIEKRSLIVGAVINLIMALSGWSAYYLSNSQALLLDGNFSFIVFLSTLVAINISSIKSKKTKLFPFGQFVYEALYSFLKGIMIIGMLLVAFTDNLSKIFHFINGKETSLLNTEVILVYSLLMTLICFGMAAYYKHQNNKVNNSSTILRAEYSAAIIDGFMSAGIGIALVGISLLSPEGSLGFLNYIGDAILVILLCVLLGKEPFILVRDSFVEVAGGTLQNQTDKKNIEDILEKHLSSEKLLIDSYISKTGSSYLVIAYISAQGLEKLGFEKTKQIRELIINNLKENYKESIFEIVLA